MTVGGYDAVLLLAFGGPDGMEDPNHAVTAAQTSALSRTLAARGVLLPVCFAMRHGAPSIRDVLSALGGEGGKRVLALILSAHPSQASIDGYVESLNYARTQLGSRAPSIQYAGDSKGHARFYDHPGFIRANSEHVLSAVQSLPAALRDDARLVFTAHSIPVAVAARSPYVEQLHETARLVAAAVGMPKYELCYQSGGGRADAAWLGPDVKDVVRTHAAAGHKALVLSPVGFVCDQPEVLYDLDVEAKELAVELGVTVARARVANDHPAFIEALADVVLAELQPDVGLGPSS